MNKFLALDTASSYLTVLAVNGGKTVLRHTGDCALRHSVMLMGEVEKALDEAALTPADCDFFCAVTGPGSFTGIRIGISAAKGFALAAGKPLMPLTAFELIAYNVEASDFCVVIDAAHGHYYACRFVNGVMQTPEYLSGETLSALNIPLYGYQSLELSGYTALNAGECLLPAVTKKLECGAPFGEVHALYVRKSQAEEGRK